MSSLRREARFAGLLYVVASLVGALRLIYIPEKLFVAGNAAATAANIAAHETLFRLGILSDLFGSVLFLFVTLALYRLLDRVNHALAVVMVILGGLMITPIFFLNTMNDAGALWFARGADFLSVFDARQREALAFLFVRLHHHGILANEIFWGLWLVPFGILVYQSRFLPRILGAWLVVACFGWLAIACAGLLFPAWEDKVYDWAQPATLGEVLTILWLAIVGAREPRPAAAPAEIGARRDT
jgi:hypothetical protein